MRLSTILIALLLSLSPFADARAQADKIGHYADGTAAKKGARWDRVRGFPLARIRTDKAPLTAGRFNVLASKRLRFAFGRGSGRDGFDTLVVDESGKAEYLFRGKGDRRHSWRLTHYTIKPADLLLLRMVLSAIGYASMHRSYHADMHDGSQSFVKVEADGKKKGVYCDNYFPKRIRMLALFVHEQLISPYERAIRRGAKPLRGWHREWKRMVGAETYPD